MSKRVQNIGKRRIGVAKGVYLEPGKVGVVNDDTSARLIRLYPKEVIDIDNIKVDFEESEVVSLEGGPIPHVEKKDEPLTPSQLKAKKKADAEAAAAKKKEEDDAEAQRQLDEEEKARLANEGGNGKEE